MKRERKQTIEGFKEIKVIFGDGSGELGLKLKDPKCEVIESIEVKEVETEKGLKIHDYITKRYPAKIKIEGELEGMDIRANPLWQRIFKKVFRREISQWK